MRVHPISPGYKDNKYVTMIQLLLAIPAPAHHPAPAHCPTRARHPAPVPSSSRLLSSACPLSLCLGLSFSSRLIVLVELARVEEEVGSSEVGSSGNASLSELVLLAVEAGAVKEGSVFLPSRRVPSRQVRVRVRVSQVWGSLHTPQADQVWVRSVPCR